MSELSELYQSVILDHNRSPRNCRAMADANADAEGYNPLCGDRLRVWVRLGADDVVEDVSFEGIGCAISQASASLMTTTVKGRTRTEALELFTRFHDLVAGDGGPAAAPGLGKLTVFAGVREYPSRVKCASLAWHALRSALSSGLEPQHQ
jgi:nitrogen fixation protein NifU and related proteins